MTYDGIIRLRIPLAEKRRLVEAARIRGVKLSEFIRMTASEAAQKVAA